MCAANRIRSPYAEAVAAERAATIGLAVEFSSAGTETDILDATGLPPVDRIVRIAGKQHLDLSGHRATAATVESCGAADVVVTMTGVQVTQIASLAPDAANRTLTLREMALAARESPPPWEPAALRSWAEPPSQRPLSGLLDGTLDVDDPVGGPARAYRRAAREIRSLVEEVLGPEPAERR